MVFWIGTTFAVMSFAQMVKKSSSPTILYSIAHSLREHKHVFNPIHFCTVNAHKYWMPSFCPLVLESKPKLTRKQKADFPTVL